MLNRNRLTLIALIVLLITLTALLYGCNKDGINNGQTETTEEPPEAGTPVNIVYSSENEDFGYILGNASQSVIYGESTTEKVTAVAYPGYKFVSWSDGSTEAVREGEAPVSDRELSAAFQLETLELPILLINTNDGEDITSKDEYKDGTISVINTDEKYLLDSFAMQIRGRGNYTWSSTFNSDPMYNKRPYRIKLSEQQKLAGVGEGKSRDWALLADHCDQSLLRNNIVYSFAKSLSGIKWQPTVQSVEVYLNGDYIGVYLLTEQVEVNSNKINVSEDITGNEVAFLVMYSNYSDLWSFSGFEVDGLKYEIKCDLAEGTDLGDLQKEYIRDYIDRCWNAVKSGSQAEIEALIDISSVIDTYIVHEVFKNLDTGHDNFYMSKDTDGKLFFGPVWDFDQCAGNADCDVDNYENIRGGDTQPWYSYLLRCTWFKKLLAARWNEIKAGQIDKIPSMITEKAEAAYKSYCRNFDIWEIFGYKINRETYVRQFTTYDEHYKYFAEFMKKRIEWLDGYWNDPSFSYDITDAFNGDGTRESPFIISGAQDFLQFTAALKSGKTFDGTYFLQTANIDLTGFENYAGLGRGSTFAGIYNGNGYIIKVDISGSDGALFPYLSGTVMNLIAEGTVNNSGIGAGITRSVRQGGAVINCACYMSITSGNQAAGIAGSNESSRYTDSELIYNCFFGGTLSSLSGQTGAINAWNSGREGIFKNNFYLASVPNSTGSEPVTKEETAIEKADSGTADLLNAALPDLANNITSFADLSMLCEWSCADDMLILNHK